jgi:hypothetical protein
VSDQEGAVDPYVAAAIQASTDSKIKYGHPLGEAETKPLEPEPEPDPEPEVEAPARKSASSARAASRHRAAA